MRNKCISVVKNSGTDESVPHDERPIHRKRRFSWTDPSVPAVFHRPVKWISILLALAAGIPAVAQVDFSGEWAPRFYEDQPERVPGPELGDYLGIPINDAGRMRGDTWSA